MFMCALHTHYTLALVIHMAHRRHGTEPPPPPHTHKIFRFVHTQLIESTMVPGDRAMYNIVHVYVGESDAELGLIDGSVTYYCNISSLDTIVHIKVIE